MVTYRNMKRVTAKKQLSIKSSKFVNHFVLSDVKGKEDGPPVERERDGEVCKRCNDFLPFAEPNQADGSTVCFMCRNDPYY